MMKMPDNTIQAVEDYFHLQLDEIWDEREATQFFYLACYHFFKWNRVDVRMNRDHRFSESELLRFIYLVKDLKKRKPIQHIFGWAPFLDYEFNVTPDTLIPRPETEELVDWVVKFLGKDKKLSVLDVGTGSGCIAVSVKKALPNVNMTAIDYSADVLKVAKSNADKYAVDVTFKQLDFLNDTVDDQFDVIISNPPYITQEEADSVESHVLDHEPHSALFAAGDALIFYIKLAELASRQKAELFVEINSTKGKEVVELFGKYGASQIDLKKDLSGRDRMVHASWGK